MMVRATPLVSLLLLLLITACASDETDTQVAIKNQGSTSIDATISDGKTELNFPAIAAGTSSTFQIATFGSLSALTVQVGDASSNIELSANQYNLVTVGTDGKVADVSVVVVSASTAGGAW